MQRHHEEFVKRQEKWQLADDEKQRQRALLREALPEEQARIKRVMQQGEKRRQEEDAMQERLVDIMIAKVLSLTAWRVRFRCCSVSSAVSTTWQAVSKSCVLLACLRDVVFMWDAVLLPLCWLRILIGPWASINQTPMDANRQLGVSCDVLALY